MKTAVEKFWERVNKDTPSVTPSLGPCWTWTKKLNDSGYGIFYINGKNTRAHRFSYSSFVEKISDTAYVLHHCDVRSCVRPDHLYVGTKRDNILDALTRKRHKVPTPPKGEQHSHAKLRDKDVLEIRELQNKGVHTRTIQSMFPVSQSTLSRIKNRRIWDHI